MAEMGITEGDFVYVLAYPMGLVGHDSHYVIAKSGSIARITDVLERRSDDFLVDAFVFHGSSGGPVVTKPEFSNVEGTRPTDKAYLVGMVSGYLSHCDVAVSERTESPRIVFEENTGLASVVPVDFIIETVETCFGNMVVVEDESADFGEKPNYAQEAQCINSRSPCSAKIISETGDHSDAEVADLLDYHKQHSKYHTK